MTSSELAQLIPRQPPGRPIKWTDPDSRDYPGAHERASRFALSLNWMFRKYNLLNATRQVHAVAQLMAETTFTAVRENGRGSGHDYEVFYGRGLMQTTWAVAYEGYGIFRKLPDIDATTKYTDTRITHTSVHLWSNGGASQRWFPRYDPEFIAVDAIAQCDAGGFYWISKALGGGDESLSRPADHGVTYQAVREVSWLVNGGFNGFEGRLTFGIYMRRVRGDSTVTTVKETVTFAYRSTYGKGHPMSNHTFTVDHKAQRP